MVQVDERKILEREVRVAARPETVFAFLTEADKVPLWMGRRAELDPRPGGIYRVEISDQIIASGEFVELDGPRRVVFTFGWENQGPGHAVPPGSSRVEISLEPDGEATLVRLRHLDLPEDSLEIHGQGWEMYLARLAQAAVGEDPGPDPAGQ